MIEFNVTFAQVGAHGKQAATSIRDEVHLWHWISLMSNMAAMSPELGAQALAELCLQASPLGNYGPYTVFSLHFEVIAIS